MTVNQITLEKILRSRIEREDVAGTLVTNQDSLIEALDILLADDKITLEQHTELDEMIFTYSIEA